MRRQMFHFPLRFSLVSFFSSLRVRLALWHLAMITLVMIVFGGNLYGASRHLSDGAVDANLETPLYEDAKRLTAIYKQALLPGQPPTSQQIDLPAREVVLLLSLEKTVLEARGPLTSDAIAQLQESVESSPPTVTIELPLSNGENGQITESLYRFVMLPILDKDTRIAYLIVGLPRESQISWLGIWLGHAIGFLLLGTIGGYWLVNKALRPVLMITKMAKEINATDLRRRLHLTRRDEFGELAATFDQMLARLEAAFKRQTQFTADASHELRTPLTIMNLEINRALTQLQTPQEFRQLLGQMQAENEQMTAVVNSLLLLARADTGQIDLHQEKVDLSDLALASVERLLPLARRSQIALSTGKLPELLVTGDPHYLSRMLMNLIENAIKYTSGIGQKVHVDLAREHGKWGVIRVQDDGPGIADEHFPFLFDRFYQVDRARARRQRSQLDLPPDKEEQGGSGLGLAIAQWIVHAHGGEIRVESKIGVGSVFELRLPLLKEKTSGEPA